MLYGGDTIERWDTPLSGCGYERLTFNKGSWSKDEFQFPIACLTKDKWDWWLCSVSGFVWLRVVSDETYDWWIWGNKLKKAEATADGFFWRVKDSRYASLYDPYLPAEHEPIKEYLIWGLESHLHFLSTQEPSFKRQAS